MGSRSLREPHKRETNRRRSHTHTGLFTVYITHILTKWIFTLQYHTVHSGCGHCSVCLFFLSPSFPFRCVCPFFSDFSTLFVSSASHNFCKLILYTYLLHHWIVLRSDTKTKHLVRLCACDAAVPHTHTHENPKRMVKMLVCDSLEILYVANCIWPACDMTRVIARSVRRFVSISFALSLHLFAARSTQIPSACDEIKGTIRSETVSFESVLSCAPLRRHIGVVITIRIDVAIHRISTTIATQFDSSPWVKQSLLRLGRSLKLIKVFFSRLTVAIE